MSPVSHYCQKCLTANPLGQELCTNCGTRLMIVVERASTRYEILDARLSSEEHLLERISALENRMGRLSDRLERALDLLLQQAQNSHFDRALVKALVGLLTDEEIVQGDKLQKLWIGRCQKDAEDQLESERREVLRHRIIAGHHGNDKDNFEKLVTEGFLFLEEEEPGRGIQSLQRAARMSPGNAPLQYYLGECLFKSGSIHRARGYLARAYELAPTDQRISLLLGLTCADEGDVERARELLSAATRLNGSSFAAHYGLGRLFVAEANWQQALQEFKLALASKVSPEAHYALGCLYYQLSKDVLATRHLRKAVKLDGEYNEAFYVLGLVSVRSGRKELAAEYFRKARRGKLKTKTRILSTDNTQTTDTINLFRPSATTPRRLVTGGDRRLADAVRRDALNACISSAYEAF
ncbi:MAG TPA: tetratricopeptide repeat protein [Pyrinomonadaceae bacterium]|nr:tetratricopeptide repeat protein [Pyrinomonadaceae bacterium]